MGRWLKRIACALMMAHPAQGFGAPALPTSWLLLEPSRDANGHPLERHIAHGDHTLPVARRLPDGSLKARILKVLSTGTPALLPAMDDAARRLTTYPVDCADLSHAIAVFLSDEDGGFARKDFLLADGRGHASPCSDYFIDITVDETSLADGEFEEVLAHEFGHVLLRRLLGPVPATPSRNAHSVFAITDPITAFDEGLGIQFQPLAARLTSTPGFRARVEGTASASAADAWLSRRETWMREAAVPRGDFDFDASLPAADLQGIVRWQAGETALPDDRCHLKSGDAMMASEGVAATFLYRLLSVGTSRRAIASRYAQLINVLARMHQWPERAPLIALVNAWGQEYPQDRAAVIRLFLESTYGATASDAVRRQAQSLSCIGAAGAMNPFRQQLKMYRKGLDQLAVAVTSGQLALDAALNPPLWLADPAIRIPASPWAPDRTLPLVLDLNTAGEPALEMLFGNRALAEAIVHARRQGGGFGNLDDASRRTGVQRRRLQLLSESFRALPAFVRQ